MVRIYSYNKPSIKGNSRINKCNLKEQTIAHSMESINYPRLMSEMDFSNLEYPITMLNSSRTSKFANHYFPTRLFNSRSHGVGRIAVYAEQQKGFPIENRPEAIQRKTGNLPIMQFGAKDSKLNMLIIQYNNFNENDRFYSDLLDHLTILIKIKKEIISNFNIGNMFTRLFSYFWTAENNEMLNLFGDVNGEIKDVIRQFLHGYDMEMIEFKKNGSKNYQPLINYFIRRFLEIINEDGAYPYLYGANKDFVLNILKDGKEDRDMHDFIAETYQLPSLLRKIYNQYNEVDLKAKSNYADAKEESKFADAKEEVRNEKSRIIIQSSLILRDYCDRAHKILNRAGHEHINPDLPEPVSNKLESQMMDELINGFARALSTKIDLIDKFLRRTETHLKKSPDRYTDIMLIRDIFNTLNGFVYPIESSLGFTSQIDAQSLEFEPEEMSPCRVNHYDSVILSNERSPRPTDRHMNAKLS